MKETLTEVRRKFWIVKGHSLVRSLIHQCVLCRHFERAPFRALPPLPLPDIPVQEEPPFSYTGIDFTGPLYVCSSDRIRSEKLWICLFTCLVTRAVHLDVVTDISREKFIRRLKRFVARKRIPRKLLSDKATAQFIKSVFKEDIVQTHLSGRNVKWVFNLKGVVHFSGWSSPPIEDSWLL